MRWFCIILLFSWACYLQVLCGLKFTIKFRVFLSCRSKNRHKMVIFQLFSSIFPVNIMYILYHLVSNWILNILNIFSNARQTKFAPQLANYWEIESWIFRSLFTEKYIEIMGKTSEFANFQKYFAKSVQNYYLTWVGLLIQF